MAQNKQPLSKKAKQRITIRTRMSIPILLVVVFQILTYFAVLIFGGEFDNIRQYAYSTLVEKTENRSTYLQNELRSKPILVQEYAEMVNSTVAELLEERGATIADLQTDKDLSLSIMESTVDLVVGLLRGSMANDAFFILETGGLYADAGGDAKAALYLRDLDPNSGSGYDDLLMGVGFASLSRDFGITRYPSWSMYFSPDQNSENFGFYYRTMQTAQENDDLSANALGYWSGFSELSAIGTASMKYTLPLIAPDGTVYGVLGIGLLESTILSSIPSNDFLRENACYVLGNSVTGDNSYAILTHSGTPFSTLLGNTDTLLIGDQLEKSTEIYGFATDDTLLGSVQYLGLYNQNSPYAAEQWALISVADRESVLQPVNFLYRMLLVSAAVSLVVAAVVAVLSCSGLIKPIIDAIKLMKSTRKYNEVIYFPPSNIYEIDEMTDAITQLQINVQEVSSEVSRMISIADVGLGTFRYDRTEDSVFVGQSLIKTLHLQLPQDEDALMTRQEFLDSIHNADARAAIAAGLDFSESDTREDYTEVYEIDMSDNRTRWIRLGYTYSTNSAVGIVQDITDTVLEKQRIEHERDYDVLTGLMNRHSYYRRVKALFQHKEDLKITAFVMVDLDNLKYVNDTYGHDFGDDYIRTAASALRKFENYGGIVARISGDEFNICLPGFTSKDRVREIIELMRGELLQSSCLLADGTHFKIRASVGISWYPDDAQSYELLMKYADFAMYTIKHATKGNIAEFDVNSYSADSVLLTGVEEMNRIIETGSVNYAFQSIVSAKTGEIYGYEALMRIQSDIFRNPLELLRTAKTGAKLYEIERLTWAKALADFQSLIDAGHIDKGAHVFINSIADCELTDADRDAVVSPHKHLMRQVVLEILESESANETYTARKKSFMEMQNGQTALDDFGTGYNSEYALLTLQPNIIKIDRSIISDCDKDASRRIIINNLVNLARTKQILVVAEGVETAEEMATVIACGVDLLQGYYLARPTFEPQPLAPELVEEIQRLSNN